MERLANYSVCESFPTRFKSSSVLRKTESKEVCFKYVRLFHIMLVNFSLENQYVSITLLHEITNTLTRGTKMPDRKLENITITMTKEEKKALKQAALDNDVSASELIRQWLAKYRENSQTRILDHPQTIE